MKKYLLQGLFTFISFIFIVTPVSASTCTILSKNLSKGSENSDVTQLQQFLVSGGYLNTKPNGYFGSDTVKAVKKFQLANVISQTGSVGPSTRAKIKSQSCSSSQTGPIGTAKTNSSMFSYTTYTTGEASSPRYVTFKIDPTVTVCSKDSPYSIDYGDNEKGVVWGNVLAHLSATSKSTDAPIPPDADQCAGYFAYHTYATQGVYTAKLIKISSGNIIGTLSVVVKSQ